VRRAIVRREVDMRRFRVLTLVVIVITVAMLGFLRSRRANEGDRMHAPARAAVATPEPATTSVPPRRADDPKARARWEASRDRIRTARAEQRPPPSAEAPCTGDACRDADARKAARERLFASFNDETTTLLQGCEEFVGETPKSLRVKAHLIGAPDIGTIVESVEVTGEVERPDELTECLTEGMYALELDDPDEDLERDLTLGMGLLAEIAEKGWMPPEAIAHAHEQMIAGGLDPTRDAMVYIAEDEPPPR
jgi:hypothetical protein